MKTSSWEKVLEHLDVQLDAWRKLVEKVDVQLRPVTLLGLADLLLCMTAVSFRLRAPPVLKRWFTEKPTSDFS